MISSQVPSGGHMRTISEMVAIVSAIVYAVETIIDDGFAPFRHRFGLLCSLMLSRIVYSIPIADTMGRGHLHELTEHVDSVATLIEWTFERRAAEYVRVNATYSEVVNERIRQRFRSGNKCQIHVHTRSE